MNKEIDGRLAELMRSLVCFVEKGIRNEQKARAMLCSSESVEEVQKQAEEFALDEMTLNFPDRTTVALIMKKAVDLIRSEDA
jgi:hypothetical protein